MKPIKWQLLLLITISLCTAILRTPGSVRGIALNDFLPAAPGIFPQEGLTPPPFQNLIQNGNFDAGADQWSFWGDIVWEVQNGMLYFYRPATATGAAIFQDISHDSTANSPYEFSVQLGNTANVDKSVMIALHHPGTWDGNIGCVFTIPANSPLQTYVVRGLTTADWPSIRFEIGVNSNDGVPDLMLDDVSVQYKPGITLNETECSAPIPQELNVVRNADFSSNVDQWSFWGDMVWEVQNGRLHFYRQPLQPARPFSRMSITTLRQTPRLSLVPDLAIPLKLIKQSWSRFITPTPG
jgi:hypothetical protein